MKTDSEMTINEKALTLSFVYVQVAVLIVSALIFLAVPDRGIFLSSQMPPLGAIYSSIGAEWMTHIRHFSHGMIAIGSILMGVVLMMVGMKNESPAVRFLATLGGIQMTSAGVLNSAEVLILQQGGHAHLLAVIIGVSVALSTVLMTLMVLMKFKYLKSLGQLVSDEHTSQS